MFITFLCSKKQDIEEEILLGHDFMERFNIKLDPKKRDIVVTKRELLYSQTIRKGVM